MKTLTIIIGILLSVIYGYIFLLTQHNAASVNMLNVEIRNFYLIIFNLFAVGLFVLLNRKEMQKSSKSKCMFVWIIHGVLLMCLPGGDYILSGSLIAASGIIATSIRL